MCHVQGDNASDENPHKVIARHMIAMTKELNAKFPDGKVHITCYTCHRGQHEPGDGATCRRDEARAINRAL